MKESIKSIFFRILFFLIVFIICVIFILYTKYDEIVVFKEEIALELKEEINISPKERADIEKKVDFAYIILGVTIISFVISFEMINKEKTPKECSKKIEDLIPPSLAEVVIDGKIEIKNLIMSTIIDLSTRGNIEIINNENIRLISKENLETYEFEIVDLIFQENTEIAFRDINNIFKKSNVRTLEFGKKIEKIKISIMDILYKDKIFSNFKTFFNKVTTLLAMLSIANIIMILVESSMYLVVEVNMIVISVYITFSLKGISILDERNYKKGQILISLIFIIIILPIVLFFEIKKIVIYKPQILLIALLIFFLNILIIKNSKDVVLTNKGKFEKIKLLKLKNYINEYSLMKDRDLSATIVWDKYLAYATSFEIPNKVTNSIYEYWYDLNLTLQFIDKAL